MAKITGAQSHIFIKVLIVGAGLFWIAAGVGVFRIIQSRSQPPVSHNGEYRGYKQGKCPDGQYEAWSGGAPTDDPDKDTICLSQSRIDDRERLYESGGTLKPAIFLYADKDTDFDISLDFNISDSFIYPAFNRANNGWKGTVLAGQNGNLVVDQKPYDYLFWEGNTIKNYKLTHGNVVSREQTTQFLEDALRSLGLNAREAGDFITFWGPRLAQNDYNLISFVNDEYSAAHPMTVSPKPDYVLRVFMVYRSVDKDYPISKQTFAKAQPRHGFSLVEWGGTEQTASE